MLTRSRQLTRCSALCGVLAVLAFAPAPACAQNGDTATVRLIQLLIQKGILTNGQAASLLAQAQEEAAAPKPPRAAPKPQATAGGPPPIPPGEVRVTYVPQFVRDEIAAQVRTQILQQVQTEHWAAPDALPEWTKRVTLYGDVRIRYQDNLENHGNVDGATGLPYPFPDFNTINSGSGFDTSGSSLPPLLNTSENRDRERIRARIGVRAQIDDWVSTDIRIATGNDNSPVSENQTLGQPGDFSKYAIYLDRAYITINPVPSTRIMAGRTPDPYFVSDLMYATDLNFDGIDLQYSQPLIGGFGVFFNAGAHPVFNESLNFASTSFVKGPSRNAYLFAAQLGGTWKINDDYAAKIAVGYFDYSDISGEPSSPCLLLTSASTCSTDDTRPAFIQFGNTLFGLRNIVTNGTTLSSTPQYYGLASHFGILDLHGKFDVHNFDPVTVSLEGEFVKNLAFNRNEIVSRVPVNNLGSNNLYQGGDTGYMLKVTVGHPETVRLWDWNASLAYKYLESDAVVDAFDDTDFHLGGTNAKGYIIGGNLGIANDTWVTARWLSATQISGPPYGNNVVQVDLNTKF